MENIIYNLVNLIALVNGSILIISEFIEGKFLIMSQILLTITFKVGYKLYYYSYPSKL